MSRLLMTDIIFKKTIAEAVKDAAVKVDHCTAGNNGKWPAANPTFGIFLKLTVKLLYDLATVLLVPHLPNKLRCSQCH